MLDILDDHLSDATTPEMKESIRQAHELFDAFGNDTYEDGFVEILMTGEQTDTGKTVQEIHDLTRSLQFKILQEHQLVIDENAPISVLNLFLSGLLHLPKYDDAAQLLGVLSMTADTLELIAECFAIVTGKSADYLLPFIMNASDRLLSDLAVNLDKNTVSTSDEDFVLKNRLVARYKHFIQISNIAKLKLAYLISNGLDVGHPFRIYLNLLGNDFEIMEAKPIAEELIAMAIISSDAADNPRSAIQDSIDRFVSDIDKVTQIEIEVGNLLLLLNAHEQA